MTLEERFRSSEHEQPFLWVIESSGSGSGPGLRTVYCFCRVDGHVPWRVLRACDLDGYRQLRERYETGADAIGRPFDSTPPGERRSDSTPRGRNPEKAIVLKEMFQEKCQNES